MKFNEEMMQISMANNKKKPKIYKKVRNVNRFVRTEKEFSLLLLPLL